MQAVIVTSREDGEINSFLETGGYAPYARQMGAWSR